MPARKLTESETQQIPILYRQAGETTATIAERFNVSNSTVSRILKDALDPAEYKALSQQKRSAGKGNRQAAVPSSLTTAPPTVSRSPRLAKRAAATEQAAPTLLNDTPATSPSSPARTQRPKLRQRHTNPDLPSPNAVASDVQLALLGEASVNPIAPQTDADLMAEALEVLQEVAEKPRLRHDRATLNALKDNLDDDLDEDGEDSVDLPDLSDLAIVADEDEFDEEDEDEEDEDEEDFDEEDGLDVAVTLKAEVAVQVLPLAEATIPHPFYLVVDRLSELITRPLREFGELGKIPEAEANSRILPIFENHRIARRFSRKNQRIIKVPEAHMLHKAKQHLTAKGINRLLIDGQIYAL